MEFIIVTGLSGAGKSRAVDALEDIGYYCVDNMPPALIVKIADLLLKSIEKRDKIAIVTDMRGGEMFLKLSESLEELEKSGFKYKILFLDASNDVLMLRYKETRRKHPLISDAQRSSLENAISRERELLNPFREKADFIIDTTVLSPAQLKTRINKLFAIDENSTMHISCISFGFKYGIPSETDLIFDVRCLPNPYYIDELRNHTGVEGIIRDFVLSSSQSKKLIPKLYNLLDYLLPLYVDEGKSHLMVSFGCTGGKHRSVVFAELTMQRYLEAGYQASVQHRDISR